VSATEQPLIAPDATIERLDRWAEQASREISTADAKASTLLGWSGTALAVTATVLASRSGGLAGAGVLVLAPALVGVGLLTCCVVALVLTVRPRLSGHAHGSFLHISQIHAVEQVIQQARPTGADDRSSAYRLMLLARIARAKHRCIQVATTCLLGAIGPLVLSAVLALAGVGR
jgi:hypothetical protein